MKNLPNLSNKYILYVSELVEKCTYYLRKLIKLNKS